MAAHPKTRRVSYRVLFQLEGSTIFVHAVEHRREAMSKDVRQRKPNRLTVRKLHSELQRLRRRVEDLEDLRDFNAAIERNESKPGIPWDEVKKGLGLR
jgi:hypothetical protein